MTQKDKLSRLIASYDSANACNQCHKHLKDCDNCEFPTLADYLLEHGVIVLPCKAGDTVYQIDFDRTIVERKVIHFIVEKDCIKFAFYIPDFGEYITAKDEKVFLTREKAEAALWEGEKHR